MSEGPPEPASEDRREFTDEQAAVRRIARLVAEGAQRSTVFPAVLAELSRLLPADVATIVRYEPGFAVTVASWSRSGDVGAVSSRAPLGGHDLPTLVFETHRPALVEIDASADAGPAVAGAPRAAMCSAAGAPVRVEGLLWGLLAVASTGEGRLAPGTEQRVAVFADLVATAIRSDEAQEELRRIAEEQAAMRRVSLLVARGVKPDLLFAAVAEEVAVLFDADVAAIERLEPSGEATLMGTHGSMGQRRPGAHVELGPRSAIREVRRTGRPARWDLDDPTPGRVAEDLLQAGIRSAVDAPIVIEGRLWGGIVVASRHHRLPADTEQRLAEFTELVATAIANAEAQSNLMQSRTRIVATADRARRRIERDLHDGAQQRLVTLSLQVRAAQAMVPPDLDELRAELHHVAVGLTDALEELRELARGIHPAVLAEGGLLPALRTLAKRSPVPVDLELGAVGRSPQQVEVSAYYIVAEALTNAAKHAQASTVTVAVGKTEKVLQIMVRDDGVGGANFTLGTGLVGIKDRVEAVGGRFSVDSPRGSGTTLWAEFPLTDVTTPSVPPR